MTAGQQINGVLVQWGDRLFYPANKVVRADRTPQLSALQQRADVIRGRIAAAVRRDPQAIVSVSGGGKGMAAITSHLRYISKDGQLTLEDERGVAREGKQGLRDLADQWRYGGTFIGNVEPRREALNLIMSMPVGTDPALLHQAVREFARIELTEHRYVMVLHRHQSSPHVHLCVKFESNTGERLKHGRMELQRWRETFAERLRGLGVPAEATRQATRGESWAYGPLWRIKAKEDGRLRVGKLPSKRGPHYQRSRSEAMKCWAYLMKALAASELDSDRRLAREVGAFLKDTPFLKDLAREHPGLLPGSSPVSRDRELQRSLTKNRSGPEVTR